MDINNAEAERARAEMSGSPVREFEPRTKQRKRDRQQPWRGSQPQAKRRHAQASERSSILAEQWVSAGAASGFEFPYDVNYFALGLQRKVESDPELQRLLRKDEHDKVERWVSKMIERWWEEYVTNEITASNAKEYFLVTDWDDLREYARTCLRAAYLLEHGVRKTHDVEHLRAGKELHDHLAEMVRESEVASFVDRALTIEESPLELDPKGRDRLRSWREKRRSK